MKLSGGELFATALIHTGGLKPYRMKNTLRPLTRCWTILNPSIAAHGVGGGMGLRGDLYGKPRNYA